MSQDVAGSGGNKPGKRNSRGSEIMKGPSVIAVLLHTQGRRREDMADWTGEPYIRSVQSRV